MGTTTTGYRYATAYWHLAVRYVNCYGGRIVRQRWVDEDGTSMTDWWVV